MLNRLSIWSWQSHMMRLDFLNIETVEGSQFVKLIARRVEILGVNKTGGQAAVLFARLGLKKDDQRSITKIYTLCTRYLLRIMACTQYGPQGFCCEMSDGRSKHPS